MRGIKRPLEYAEFYCISDNVGVIMYLPSGKVKVLAFTNKVKSLWSVYQGWVANHPKIVAAVLPVAAVLWLLSVVRV